LGWNFGDVLDAIEPVLPPDEPALISGDRVVAWAELSRTTNNLARGLIARGARPGDKLAIYMRNRPEYLMSLSAAFKARLTHVNVNYRYTPGEVCYILDNSDANVVVYAEEFRDAVKEIREELPKVETWVEVSRDGQIAPFAEAFDAIASEGEGAPLDIVRSGDDQLFIYTGGTTGMPKGVMWTHQEFRDARLKSGWRVDTVAETVQDVAAEIVHNGPGPRILATPPLMHGTGMVVAMVTMLAGGSVVLLEGQSLDAQELLRAVDRWRPQTVAIVGDSYAKPILEALAADPRKYDISSITNVVSAGVMWSMDVKRALLEHMPNATLVDAFSSSEAIGMGASRMSKGTNVQTAKFMLGTTCQVFDEHDRPVEPGSGVPGLVAIGPPTPLGYYKDEVKSAQTFREIDGVRYTIPGDWCLVEADGAITLLGRGSGCINTAGEKVFPEEVEEVLKTHSSVDDALVIGLPDDKWGEAVTAVVALRKGAALDEGGLRKHVRQSLAGYKVPKRILATDLTLRGPNGKPDYTAARSIAEALTTRP
jgi:Acyl-CoA synthetases (AMP-forming)/AMP-acid ligases II